MEGGLSLAGEAGSPTSLDVLGVLGALDEREVEALGPRRLARGDEEDVELDGAAAHLALDHRDERRLAGGVGPGSSCTAPTRDPDAAGGASDFGACAAAATAAADGLRVRLARRRCELAATAAARGAADDDGPASARVPTTIRCVMSSASGLGVRERESA